MRETTFIYILIDPRDIIPKANKGRVKSSEECKKISKSKEGVKRKPFTAEARANMGAATKKRYAMKKLLSFDIDKNNSGNNQLG